MNRTTGSLKFNGKLRGNISAFLKFNQPFAKDEQPAGFVMRPIL